MNPRQHAPKACALPDCATFRLEPRSGFEPLCPCPYGAGVQNPCNHPDYATLAQELGRDLRVFTPPLNLRMWTNHTGFSILIPHEQASSRCNKRHLRDSSAKIHLAITKGYSPAESHPLYLLSDKSKRQQIEKWGHAEKRIKTCPHKCSRHGKAPDCESNDMPKTKRISIQLSKVNLSALERR